MVGDFPRKFKPPTEINETKWDVFESIETATNFLDFFRNYSIKEYFKSEPIPVTNEGQVKIVVYDTFEEIVEDKNQDVLLFWFSPFC